MYPGVVGRAPPLCLFILMGVLAGRGSILSDGKAFCFHGTPLGACPFTPLGLGLLPGAWDGTDGNKEGSRSFNSSMGGNVREKSVGLRIGVSR